MYFKHGEFVDMVYISKKEFQLKKIMQCICGSHVTHSFLSGVNPLHCGNGYTTDDFLRDCFQLCCFIYFHDHRGAHRLVTYFCCTHYGIAGLDERNIVLEHLDSEHTNTPTSNAGECLLLPVLLSILGVLEPREHSGCSVGRVSS